jgi:hypothetical protein
MPGDFHGGTREATRRAACTTHARGTRHSTAWCTAAAAQLPTCTSSWPSEAAAKRREVDSRARVPPRCPRATSPSRQRCAAASRLSCARPRRKGTQHCAGRVIAGPTAQGRPWPRPGHPDRQATVSLRRQAALPPGLTCSAHASFCGFAATAQQHADACPAASSNADGTAAPLDAAPRGVVVAAAVGAIREGSARSFARLWWPDSA